MKKVLLFAFVAVFMITVTSSASSFNQNKTYEDSQMFEEFNITGDPDFDLAVFAKKNNLSKKEAKKILSKKFGDPQKPNEKFFIEVTASGDPDADLENFALAHNISKDDAKMILEKLFGEPEMQ